MRKSDFVTKIVMGVILLAVICYIGFYIVSSFVNPFKSTLAVKITVRESFSVSGIVVRNETVVSTGGYSSVNVVLSEGERVETGGTVASVYNNEGALVQIREMEALDAKIESFGEILEAGVGTANVRTLDEDIKSRVFEMVKAVRNRSFSDISDIKTELEANILKKTAGSEDLQSKLLILRQQRLALGSAASSAKRIVAPVSGIFSSSVDGFENLKTKDLGSLTVSSLNNLLLEKKSAGPDAIGKLVSGTRWYYAAIVGDDDADRLEVGDNATMIFGRYLGTEINMDVESIGNFEGGKCVVVFSSNRAMADTLSVRTQSVEIIFEEHSGIRVPKQAVKIKDDSIYCIYTLSGSSAEEKAVEILFEDDDYYIVQSTDSSSGLRSGDEIITSTKGLYNGKIVR